MYIYIYNNNKILYSIERADKILNECQYPP